jgi:hypothetical protein
MYATTRSTAFDDKDRMTLTMTMNTTLKTTKTDSMSPPSQAPRSSWGLSCGARLALSLGSNGNEKGNKKEHIEEKSSPDGLQVRPRSFSQHGANVTGKTTKGMFSSLRKRLSHKSNSHRIRRRNSPKATAENGERHVTVSNTFDSVLSSSSSSDDVDANKHGMDMVVNSNSESMKRDTSPDDQATSVTQRKKLVNINGKYLIVPATPESDGRQEDAEITRKDRKEVLADIIHGKEEKTNIQVVSTREAFAAPIIMTAITGAVILVVNMTMSS